MPWVWCAQVGSIENEFRVFNMELLAGEARTATEVVQHGMRFHLDFAQVRAIHLSTCSCGIYSL
jgi:tRNA G37 N-methylase Trm5